MSRQLEERTVIVTGAGTGIGAGVAKHAAKEGAAVLLVGRTVQTLEETRASIVSDGGVAVVEQADVTRQEDVERIVERAVSEWGRIDGLVNNAGVFEVGHCLELSRESWESIIAVNLSALFFLSQAAGRVMAAAGRGSIVNMASVDGHHAEGTNAPYNTAKSGIYGLTRSFAIDLGPFGVRCNSVSPGYVESTAMAEDTSDSEESLSTLLADWKRAPLRRMVTVEEVAATCGFLISDGASGISGTDVVVDGGLISNLWALESVPAVGWGTDQDTAIERVRATLR